MAYSITPSLGIDLSYVGDKPYYDDNSDAPTPALGSVVKGSDGGEYYFVKASADIASTASTGTQVTITFPAYTVATGSGGFYTPAATAITSGQYLWVRRGADNAVPA